MVTFRDEDGAEFYKVLRAYFRENLLGVLRF